MRTVSTRSRAMAGALRRILTSDRTNRRRGYGRIPVRVAFHGFWPRFSLQSFSAAHPYLKLKYELIECSRRPDLHFISVFRTAGPARRDAGGIPLPGDGQPTVFYTGERVSADLDRFDWSISYDESRDGRALYLPGWVRHLNRLGVTPYGLIRRNGVPRRQRGERRPCAYLFHNRTRLREAFFDALSLRMEVVSPGRSHNNHPPVGRSAPEKLAFLRHFRFNVAFENERFAGYLTEKMADAFAAGCVPIYYGDPHVEGTFSPAAFVHVRGEPDFGRAIERVMALERDPLLFEAARHEAPLLDNRLPDYATHGYAMEFLERIFDDAVSD